MWLYLISEEITGWKDAREAWESSKEAIVANLAREADIWAQNIRKGMRESGWSQRIFWT